MNFGRRKREEPTRKNIKSIFQGQTKKQAYGLMVRQLKHTKNGSVANQIAAV